MNKKSGRSGKRAVFSKSGKEPVRVGKSGGRAANTIGRRACSFGMCVWFFLCFCS